MELSEGDRVLIQWPDDESYWGIVKRVHGSGAFDILYEDDEQYEEDISPSLVLEHQAGGGGGDGGDDGGDGVDESEAARTQAPTRFSRRSSAPLAAGTRVDCVYTDVDGELVPADRAPVDGDEWYPGRIEKAYAGEGGAAASYMVVFDDGDMRDGVPADHLRELPEADSQALAGIPPADNQIDDAASDEPANQEEGDDGEDDAEFALGNGEAEAVLGGRPAQPTALETTNNMDTPVGADVEPSPWLQDMDVPATNEGEGAGADGEQEGGETSQLVRDTFIHEAFMPTFDNPSHMTVTRLAANPAELATAEPQARLAVLHYQIAALEQQHWSREMCGTAWDSDEPRLHSPGDPAQAGDGGSGTAIWEALFQMRMRAMALVRLNNGSNSLAMLQAVVDLSRSYASQALWPQVATHLARGTQLLKLAERELKIDGNASRPAPPGGEGQAMPPPGATDPHHQKWVGSPAELKATAEVMLGFFGELRGLASEFNGMVPWAELVSVLANSPHPLLADAPYGIRRGGAVPWSGLNQLDGQATMTWGGAMAFLRSQHAGFQEMAKSLEDGLRSDHLALIRLAFHAVQPTKNPACGVANPKALALALSRTPATARELDGAKIADSLFERMTTVSVRSPTTGAGSDAKIPVAWEEVLAIFATEQSDTAEWMSRLRSDLLLLEGQMMSHTGRLEEAERTLLRTQHELAPRAETISACSCYTTIAEMYVQKYLRWRQQRGERAKESAEDWLASDEGHALWRSEVKRLLSESKDQERRLTRLELEYRARQALLKAHAEHVKASSDADVPDHFDKAEEYLLRIWEIHESAFGRNHVGTAASCLSLGNLCVINSDLAQAKQWFKSAIEIFDHVYGRCMQVTAATESQLGHVEAKLGRRRRALAHLSRAADYYLETAKATVSPRPAGQTEDGGAQPPVPAGGDATDRRRVKLATKAHQLWMESGRLWAEEGESLRACDAYEQALNAIGAMQGPGEASAEALKLLLHALRAFGAALEAADKWRKAEGVYTQLKTLTSRLLGKSHKATKAAAVRAKRAEGRAKSQPESPVRPKVPDEPYASPDARAEVQEEITEGAAGNTGGFTGDESWLN